MKEKSVEFIQKYIEYLPQGFRSKPLLTKLHKSFNTAYINAQSNIGLMSRRKPLVILCYHGKYFNTVLKVSQLGLKHKCFKHSPPFSNFLFII